MTRYLLSGAALLCIAAAPADAPRWAVDKRASQLGFSSSFGGAAFQGRFARWDATIRFDPKALDRSSVTAVIDLASATTGDSSRDQSLPQPDWFNTARFPRATFVAKQFQALGGDRYVASGQLTLRGVTRPVKLPFRLQIAGNQARMQGTATLNRTAFGVGQGQFASADTVPLTVQVRVSLTARRQP